jgi:hypothetical protein
LELDAARLKWILSSVIVTVILAKADMLATPIPLLVLGTTCVFAGLLAIIAVVPAYHWKRRRIVEPNLLFSGSFAEMTEQMTALYGALKCRASVVCVCDRAPSCLLVWNRPAATNGTLGFTHRLSRHRGWSGKS